MIDDEPESWWEILIGLVSLLCVIGGLLLLGELVADEISKRICAGGL